MRDHFGSAAGGGMGVAEEVDSRGGGGELQDHK